MRSIALSLGLVAAMMSSAAVEAGQFPQIQSQNLNERPLNLPEDFSARRSVLLIAYEQDQQPIVDTWFPFLAEVAGERDDVKYYELPTIGSAMGLIRGFIDGGMRSGIADITQRERTITLYTDVDALQAALGISRTDTIHAVVVDETGKVLTSVSGAYSAQAAQAIAAAL